MRLQRILIVHCSLFAPKDTYLFVQPMNEDLSVLGCEDWDLGRTASEINILSGARFTRTIPPHCTETRLAVQTGLMHELEARFDSPTCD